MAGTQQKYVIGFLCIGLCFLTAQARAEKSNVLFTSPVCATYYYEKPIKQQNGAMREAKFGNAYCTEEDVNDLIGSPQSVMNQLNAIFKDKDFHMRHVDMAFYIIKDQSIMDVICEKYAQDKFTLRLIKQQGYLVHGRFVRGLRKCMGKDLKILTLGCDIFKQKCLDPREHQDTNINTMHMKLLMIEGERHSKEEVLTVAGSGNIGSGLFANFEDWLMLTSEVNGPIHTRQRCMLSTLLQTKAKALSNSLSSKAYADCVREAKVGGTENGISAMMLPAETEAFIENIGTAIDEADAIDIMASVLRVPQISDALIRAVKKGVSVRIIMDDNLYYAGLTNDYLHDARPNAYAALLPLVHAGVKLRYLETNHEQEKLRNMIHHRFVITHKAGVLRVFTGSAHLTQQALHWNFENQYILDNPAITETYAKEFDMLWERALPTEEMPTTKISAILNKKK